jgi:pectate lyase
LAVAKNINTKTWNFTGPSRTAYASDDLDGSTQSIPSEGARAFPGAEGLAANTRGAAGYIGNKSIAIVSNLNDSGAGSFRDAVSGAGKEGTVVVFNVSGIIELTSGVQITSPYITIAGQTSPGGVCTKGAVVEIMGSSHDVIIRHMRFRIGERLAGINEVDHESFRIWGPARDIFIDHSSMSWGGDETASVTSYHGSFQRITFSHCITSHGLTSVAPEGNHGYGLYMNGQFNNTPENTGDVHNCLFAHCNDRMPQIGTSGRYTVGNNIIYNMYKTQGCKIGLSSSALGQGNLFVNYVNNYIKPGVDTNSPIGAGGNSAEVTSGPNIPATPWPAVYMNNNYGVTRPDYRTDEWAISAGYSGSFLSKEWQAVERFSTTEGVPITPRVLAAGTADSQSATAVLDMGATKPVRDSYDQSLVDNFINGTGTLWATHNDIVWPTYATPAAPTDTSGDGIPDAWGAANIPSYNSSNRYHDVVVPTDTTLYGINWTGYTWLEVYANGYLIYGV